MTDHTDLREQISDLLDEFAPVSSTRIVADEIVNRLVAPVLERAEAEAQRLADDAAASAQHHTELRRALIAARIEITRLRDLGQQLCAAIGVPDAVEPIGWARDLRAELERLRAAGTEVRRHWLSQWPSSRLAVRDVSPPLHDAIDDLATTATPTPKSTQSQEATDA